MKSTKSVFNPLVSTQKKSQATDESVAQVTFDAGRGFRVARAAPLISVGHGVDREPAAQLDHLLLDVGPPRLVRGLGQHLHCRFACSAPNASFARWMASDSSRSTFSNPQ